MAGILWFLAFQALGLSVSLVLLSKRPLPLRLWLGSVMGSVAAQWLPVPFAFALGFTAAAQLWALGTALLLAGAAILFARRRAAKTEAVELPAEVPPRSDLPLLIGLLLFLALCAVLLLSHTLADGRSGLYTGQCTYGDMAMHLSFITSLAVQGTFPPHYSIFPSAKLCYPFLCDSISSSLFVLGSSLRMAYILPMLFALAQVFCGVWFLACAFCRQKRAPLLALCLFFLNGGFGTVYFLKGDYSWQDLFTGFYLTPTNLTEKNIRWVNVIADMLIPQRATLFGWALLFACLWMLYRAVFERDEVFWLPAGLLGGLLPMVHTHSYLSLGLIAFCWLLYTLRRDGLNLPWFLRWLRFGGPAVLLAVPQLLEWTLQSVDGNAQFLRLGLDWVNNGQENWFLFWFKNIGPMFLLIPLCFYFSDRRGKAFASGALLIFALGEFLLFQPNPYDNNKLFYVGYLLLCILCAEGICGFLARIRRRPLRIAALALLLLLCTNAAVLTLAREVCSGLSEYHYQLFSAGDVSAAEFIAAETEPDALFLTADNHNNAVASLSGRNILCGSASYLYYHGLNYEPMQQLELEMLTDPQVFEDHFRELGVDYVYFGTAERSLYGDTLQWLSDHYPMVFSSDGVMIFDVRETSGTREN